MSRIIFLFVTAALTGFSSLAQPADSKTSLDNARNFARQGDLANALIVLNAAIQKDPQNLELAKELAFDYYLQRDYTKGLSIARPLTDRTDADVPCYQITGLFYKALDDGKECEKLYKAGLKRFPHSGVLYNEYGELQYARNDHNEAIKIWEKGIEIDPNCSTNYYNACKFYYVAENTVWSLLYGETFINLESYSKRTAEIKDLLLDNYKKFFTDANPLKKQDPSPFISAYVNILTKLNFMVSQGVTTESLTLLRTKFILNWFETYPSNFPFRLFDYQRQLLKDGMFTAYNEWIFGAAENLPAFQTWTNTHSEEYNKFTEYQKGRIFKLPEGQYYQYSAAK